MKVKVKVVDNKIYSGQFVSDYVVKLTEDPEMVVDYWLYKYVEPNRWILKEIPIKEILKDRSFKEVYDDMMQHKDEDGYYFRYQSDEVDPSGYKQPIVFYSDDTEKILVDGYSRTIEHILYGEDTITAYVNLKE